MTTFKIDSENSRDCIQGTQGASGMPTPQVSPQLNGNVPTDSANEPPQPQISGPDPNINDQVYEGFQFFKADPLPGQKATWTRVERTHMHLSQGEFYKMVHKRASKVSAAQQYQNLSDVRRAHVNQLIHEQRRSDSSNEWSCVYAKERDRPVKARNAHRDDYETVSMDIILMKRPMKTKSYPRTPMGDLVDLGMSFGQNNYRPSRIMLPSAVHSVPPFMPGQVIGPGHVVQGPLPRPTPVTRRFRGLDLGQPATGDQYNGLHGQMGYEKENRNIDNQSGWSSSEMASDDDDDESMIFDESQSDSSSETEHADDMDCGRETPQQQDQPIPRRRSCSPNRRDTGTGSRYRRKSLGRNMERKLNRFHPLRQYHIDMISAKNNIPCQRARGPGAGADSNKMWEKKYRIQRIDDEELRSRLLGCEARIEQWERAFANQTRILQSTIKESHQLQRCKSFWDFSSMRHCGCDCTKTSGLGNNN